MSGFKSEIYNENVISVGGHVLGTPETRRRGRSTLKARSAFTSKPPGLPPCEEGAGLPAPC